MPDRLYHVEDDWYEWRQRPPLAADVYVRIAPDDDGRLGLAELRIVGEPTSELLRAVPVGRIEAAANAQLAALDDAAGSRRVAVVRRRAASPGGRPAAADGWDTAAGNGSVRRRRDRDPARSRRGRPDRFYADVAAAYRRLARSSRRPAAELAEQHDVPVTTAHRWIKEARRRGLLPAGRPGKSG